MKAWHFRFARGIIYAGLFAAAVGVAIASAADSPGLGRSLVTARQLYGLWALALLLSSILLGPLMAVFPWLPLKPSLLYGRRAVGVGALCFALLHVGCYVWSFLLRSWRELYTPGVLWVVGLALGVLALGDMLALGLTSTDAAVKRMGGRRWKRLHRTIYWLLLIVLVHAVCVGADFGLNRGPDVSGSPDAGALVGFLSVSLAWIVLFTLRHRGVRWAPRYSRAGRGLDNG